MMIRETDFKDLFIVEHKFNSDSRGDFFEIFRLQSINERLEYSINFCQENLVRSSKNVLRGLHFQNDQYLQSKLVSVVKGSIFDVAVDLRKESSTYGKHFKVEISSKNHRQLWIPPGFAHGFIALEDNTIFSYKCTNYYSKEHEMDLLWNDVDLDIHWGIEDPILSGKDQNAKEFKNFESPF